mgnify:CR=1 FL=1|tara:strand:+ start:130284 stop:130448 length:165 start_codon:yes stop_codon:yes gene_type:complete
MEINLKQFVLAFLLGTLAITGLTGCDKDGAMEEAGEEVDEAVSDAKRGIEDATD